MRQVTEGNSCGLSTQGSRGGVLLRCVEAWDGASPVVNGQSVSLPSYHAHCGGGSSETWFAAPRRRQLHVSALIYRPCYLFQKNRPERSHHCWSSNITHDSESFLWIALMKTLAQHRGCATRSNYIYRHSHSFFYIACWRRRWWRINLHWIRHSQCFHGCLNLHADKLILCKPISARTAAHLFKHWRTRLSQTKPYPNLMLTGRK